METYSMYIDGEWCPSESGNTYQAIDPATGEAIGLVPEGTREDARRAIAAAQKAQRSWMQVPIWERATLCIRMAEVIERNADELARVLTQEQGKPHHREARDEARQTPNNYRQAAEHIKWLEGSTIPVADPHKYCRLQNPPPWRIAAPEVRLLQEMVRRLHALSELAAQEKNRAQAPGQSKAVLASSTGQQ